MSLIRNGRAADDPWTTVGDDGALPDGPAIVTLARWQAARDELAARNAPLGLRLRSDQPPALVAADLGRFAVVALEFPKFTDGRAYSHARLLRERHGYRGELRAVGNVLRDQLLFMQRCGFDAFEVADEKAAAWDRAMAEFSVRYQPAGDDRPAALALRHGAAAPPVARNGAANGAADPEARAQALRARYRDLDATEVLRAVIQRDFPGRTAVVSSFGAESAVILDLVARIDPSTPVVFLETGKHFPETLAYRDLLAARLGLTDVRSIAPAPDDVARQDRDGLLWFRDANACCAMRKVRPLVRGLAGFDAWITGRKRYHGAARQELELVELVDGRVKVNPLAHWTPARIAAAFKERGLPPHPLEAAGFPSIGCAPCTRPALAGQPMRSGRWSGTEKTECGIHWSL